MFKNSNGQFFAQSNGMPLAVIVGAGDVGYPFAVELLRRGWKVLLTRRSRDACSKLCLRIRGEMPEMDGSRILVMQLDPVSENYGENFAVFLADHGANPDMLVLASGKAMLDSVNFAESYANNIATNVDTKWGIYSKLAWAVQHDRAKLIVISSRVLDFAFDSQEVQTQTGYYRAMSFLEYTFRTHSFAKPHFCRFPLVAGSTADEYKEKGIVPADMELQDASEFARTYLDGVLAT